MKTNEELQTDVQYAIKWEPQLHAAEIGVTAKEGIVTLTGTVDSYMKKLGAENAAKNVLGVTGVVEHIKINFGSSWIKSDNDIAEEVVNALNWTWEVPKDTLKVKVENGHVTLEGELPWNYQKQAADKAVFKLPGVTGLTSNITIKSDSKDAIEQKDIEEALERHWSINNRDIKVKVSGNRVTLTGMVSSWYQKDEAERIAWNAPGVWSVNNELVIDYEYAFA